MQTKLIQTKDYLLLINEEAEIKINESTYDFEICPCFGKNKHTEGIVWSFNDKRMHIENFIETTETGDSGYDIIKINGYCLYPIAAYYPLTKEAKLLNLPLLPPFEEIDIEKLAEENNKLIGIYKNDTGLAKSIYMSAIKNFKDGYKAAQSHSKQFSLDDVINYSNWLSQWLSYNKYKKVIDGAKPYGIGELISNKVLIKMFVAGLPSSNPPLSQETIQSLSTQRLPKEFIPEYEDGCLNYTDNKTCDKPCDNMFCLPKGKLELKTITNLEGKQELVGTYKY